ncbi:hypothetical protein AU510_12355 [Lonsdalea britannica]|uniref:hypothetical protein n=1 Tax=Lonsdalea britannica TaxID=1082704 RepID=UPI000A2170E0|nr:hypothetical protein [Lonsdalea britannica]OSN04208.1 hypothetical protein AU510_12355 [Lonsdalea britannica]
MHRIDTGTAQVDKFGEGKNGFTRGNPQTGTLATELDDDYFDALQEEICGPIEAAGLSLEKGNRGQLLAALRSLFLSRSNPGSDIGDDGSSNTFLKNIGLGTGLTGVIGGARNAKMTVISTSSQATFTADELIVGESLGGLQYRIGNFNKTINLTRTGAGGMDTGSSPNWGYVALYAIYNPTTAESALLAVDSTNSVPSTVYGGANMPSGFIASALVSIVPTRPGSVFAQLSQIGRTISVRPTPVLSTSTATAELTPVDISGGVPKGAVSVVLVGNTSISGSDGLFLNIYETSVGTGQHQFANTSTGLSATAADIQLPDSQMVYATYGPAASGFSQVLSVCSYKI